MMIPDPLNTVLILKDTINSLLLDETRKSLNLAHLSTSIEEKIRHNVEQALKAIKADFEVRKRAIQHEILCLDRVALRLVTSEQCLRKPIKEQVNAETKKADKRIREAQRVLQEYLPKHEQNDNMVILSAGIRKLCCNLAKIPFEINGSFPSIHSVDSKKGERMVSQTWKTPSTSNSDLAKVEQTPHTTFSPNSRNQIRFGLMTKENSHLSEVDLFSNSESESDIESSENSSDVPFRSKRHFEESSDVTMEMNKNTAIADHTKKNPNELKFTTKTMDGGVVLKAVNGREAVLSTNMKQQDEPSKLFEEMLKPTLPTTRENNQGRSSVQRSLSLRESGIETEQVFAKSFPRTTMRRILPPVPLNKEQTETMRQTNDTCGYRSHTIANDKDTTDNEIRESFDVEEIKFKETVRTARREIIEKLKSRYAISPDHKGETGTSCQRTNHGVETLKDDSKPDSFRPDSSIHSKPKGDNSIQQIFDLSEPHLNVDQILKSSLRELGLEGCSDGNNWQDFQHNRTANMSQPNCSEISNTYTGDHEVFFSRLIPVVSDKADAPTRKNSSSHPLTSNMIETSVVEKAIQRFDNGRKKPQLFRMKRSARSRSVDSINLTEKDNEPAKRTIFWNNALLPRTSSCDDIAGKNVASLNLNTSFNQKSSVQDDLNKVCDLDSSVLIRRQWSQRKSNSVNTKSSQNQNTKPEPEFCFHESFNMPDHGTRCHASRIVVLDNSIVAIYDENHSVIHFYDDSYLYLFHYNVPHVVSGMAPLTDQRLVVAYAYKSKAVIYLVLKTEMIWSQEIVVQCGDWLSDIGFTKGNIFVLCKPGHIHVYDDSGKESKTLAVGKSGRLLVHPSGRRFFVIGEGVVSRFGADGQLVSTIHLTDAYTVILYNDKLFMGDRVKHRIVPVDANDFVDLVADHLKFPSEICLNKDMLFVSQFEEGMESEDSRAIKIFRKKVQSSIRT